MNVMTSKSLLNIATREYLPAFGKKCRPNLGPPKDEGILTCLPSSQ